MISTKYFNNLLTINIYKNPMINFSSILLYLDLEDETGVKSAPRTLSDYHQAMKRLRNDMHSYRILLFSSYPKSTSFLTITILHIILIEYSTYLNFKPVKLCFVTCLLFNYRNLPISYHLI